MYSLFKVDLALFQESFIFLLLEFSKPFIFYFTKLISRNFCLTIFQTKKFVKLTISKSFVAFTRFLSQSHSMKICKFFPHDFLKNFVKLTFSLKSYTVNQFDEKILQLGKISEITTRALCKSKFHIFLKNMMI